MMLRHLTVLSVLVAAGACDVPSNFFGDPLLSSAPNNVAGIYELRKVDGDPLPAGAIFGGALELHAGEDTYAWRMTQVHSGPGTTTVDRYQLSAGAYTSDNGNLTLIDSADLGTMTGVINANVVTVAAEHHEYEFHKWVPNVAGEYIMLGCWTNGDSAGCAETDSQGTVVTIVNGWLYLGPRDGRDAYDWYVARRYDYPDGTSNVVQSLLSQGSYALDGTSLTLVDDSGDMPAITAAVSNFGGLVTLVAHGRRYEFGKLSRLPG